MSQERISSNLMNQDPYDADRHPWQQSFANLLNSGTKLLDLTCKLLEQEIKRKEFEQGERRK